MKKLRTEAGLSQAQLARIAGINVRTLQGYEQGRDDINGIALSAAVRLAAALRCSVYDLLDVPTTAEAVMDYAAVTEKAVKAGKSNCALCAKAGLDIIWPENQLLVVYSRGDKGPGELMCWEHHMLLVDALSKVR